MFINDEYNFEKRDNVGPGEAIVKFENADIAWAKPAENDEEKTKPILEKVDLEMKKGDMICVVGKVGCGKSTFLQSVMNETNILNGSSFIRGKIAYVEQEPFIFSASVKENIAFGEEFNQEKMDRAI